LSNPYEPPKAPLETSQERPGFRWRLIASGATALSGAPLVLLGLIAIGTEVVESIVVSDKAVPVMPMMRGVGIFTAGSLWIVSGAMFWKRKWWIAAVFLIVGYAVGVLTFTSMR
jgi:hypothetical protein